MHLDDSSACPSFEQNQHESGTARVKELPQLQKGRDQARGTQLLENAEDHVPEITYRDCGAWGKRVQEGLLMLLSPATNLETPEILQNCKVIYRYVPFQRNHHHHHVLACSRVQPNCILTNAKSPERYCLPILTVNEGMQLSLTSKTDKCADSSDSAHLSPRQATLLLLHRRIVQIPRAISSRFAPASASAPISTAVSSPTAPRSPLSPLDLSSASASEAPDAFGSCSLILSAQDQEISQTKIQSLLSDIPYTALHGKTCSFEEYLKIPNGGRNWYHLIKGSIYQQPRMPNPWHNNTQGLVKTYVESQNLKKPRKSWLSVFLEAGIAISQEHDLLQSKSKRKIITCVIADIAIGPFEEAKASPSDKRVNDKRKQGSAKKSTKVSKSKIEKSEKDIAEKICFPPGKIPILIIEVVSPSNRLQDICVKVTEYACIGVPQYVIIDREANHVRVHYMEKPSFDSNSNVLDLKRTSPRLVSTPTPSGLPIYRYSATFCGDEVVKSAVLEDLGLSANMILRPQLTSTEVIASAALEAKKVTKEKLRKSKQDKREVLQYLEQTSVNVPSHIKAKLETSSSSSSSSSSRAYRSKEESSSSKRSPPASPPRQKQRKT